MKFLKKNVLTRFFIILMTMVFIAIGMIIYIWSTNANKIIEELSEHYITDTISNMNTQFENKYLELRNEMSVIENNDFVRSFITSGGKRDKDEVMEYIVDSQRLLSEDVINVTIIAENDKCSIGTHVREGNDYEELYQELETAKGQIIFLQRNNTSERYAITLGKLVRVSEDAKGIILFDISQDVIAACFGRTHLNGNLNTLLVDTKDQLIHMTKREFNEEDINKLIEYVRTESVQNELQIIEINEKEYFISSRTIVSPIKWTTITVSPLEKIYGTYKNMVQSLITVMITIVAITTIAALVFFAGLKERFSNLNDYIEKIDLYNIDEISKERVTVKDDEIGQIYKKIYEMEDLISSQLVTLEELEEKKRQDEIQILKSQINPHLIYNTLNMIQTSAEFQKNTLVSSVTRSLSKLLQYSVTNTSKLVTLQDELDYIGDYINIMQSRYIHDIDFVVMVEDEVRDCKVLKMLLQPIVENSFKYGFTDKTDQFICIKAYLYGSRLYIKIMDNGLGIAEDKIEDLLSNKINQEEHIGLNNINRRIKLAFGQEYGLSISSVQGEQTVVSLEIPVLYDREDSKNV